MKGIKMAFAMVKSPLVFTGLVFGLVTGSPVRANSFNIDVNNDDIAVEATNASLRELLQELEKLTGIPVKFVSDADERVTLNVGLTTIENAIGKITPNHMIVHKRQDGKEVIEELIIIPAKSDLASGGSGSAFLPNGNPAPSVEQPQANQQQVNQQQAGQQQQPNGTPPLDPNQPPTGEPAIMPSPNGQVN